MMMYLNPQLWQQITNGPTQTYSHNSVHSKIKGSKDKECNQIKQGDSGETEEKDCNGSPAYAVCGGNTLKYLLVNEGRMPYKKWRGIKLQMA